MRDPLKALLAAWALGVLSVGVSAASTAAAATPEVPAEQAQTPASKEVVRLADWVIATLALAGAFRLGSGLASRRATALAGVVRAFAEEAAAWRDATEDGEITDEEALCIKQVTEE